MPTAPSRPGRKEIIDYLRASSAPLQTAIATHRDFMTQLTPLYNAANAGQTAGAAIKARTLGKKYSYAFKKLLALVESLPAPRTANRCHEYFRRWLQFLVSACDALPGAPEDGRDTTYLRDCHDYLDDARYAAKALTELRQRLHDAVMPAASKTPAAAAPAAAKER